MKSTFRVNLHYLKEVKELAFASIVIK